MHKSSIWHMNDCIGRFFSSLPKGKVLDIGSRNRSAEQAVEYRRLFEAIGWEYVGADLESGHNVDLVLNDPYMWDIPNEYYDGIISGQMLEHNEYFWLSFLEMARVLRIGGRMIHIAPSRGVEHRAPQDCWRFYRDGMRSLASWSGLSCIEATTDWSSDHLAALEVRKPRVYGAIPRKGLFKDSEWGDTVGVFEKSRQSSDAGLGRRYLAELAARSGAGGSRAPSE